MLYLETAQLSYWWPHAQIDDKFDGKEYWINVSNIFRDVVYIWNYNIREELNCDGTKRICHKLLN